MEPISAVIPPQGLADPEAFQAQRADKAYKDFEAVFLKEMLKAMRKTVPDGGLFEKTNATETYEEMLDGVFAQAMADSGQFGVAKEIEAQVRLQEQQWAETAEREMERGAMTPLKSQPDLADIHRRSLGTGE